MKKENLRQLYKEKRASLTEALVASYSLKIANNLLKLPIWDKEKYHIFLSSEKKKEVNTEYLLPILWGKEKQVITSKTIFETQKMKHILLKETTSIFFNKWGIPEPLFGEEVSENEIDIVFVPLLAYDKKGNRIGYGKGFYDSFLAECKKNVLKIGLSFFDPEPEIDDIFSIDIPLDICVTPFKIHYFTQ